MKKQEVIERLCELASSVGERRFGHTRAHDCFCGHGLEDPTGFRFSEEVMEFIEEAVEAALVDR